MTNEPTPPTGTIRRLDTANVTRHCVACDGPVVTAHNRIPICIRCREKGLRGADELDDSTIGGLRAYVEKTEAEAAIMREELNIRHRRQCDRSHPDPDMRSTTCAACTALATDAGKSLHDRVTKAEAEAAMFRLALDAQVDAEAAGRIMKMHMDLGAARKELAEVVAVLTKLRDMAANVPTPEEHEAFGSFRVTGQMPPEPNWPMIAENLASAILATTLEKP